MQADNMNNFTIRNSIKHFCIIWKCAMPVKGLFSRVELQEYSHVPYFRKFDGMDKRNITTCASCLLV